MPETNCSCCKKSMPYIIKSVENSKKKYYKTCEVCRKKQKERYAKLKEITEIKEEIKEEKTECYICFNEFEKDIKGVECFQCKKSCCGSCYMNICITSKDCFKCGICRFQEYSKPFNGNKEQMVEIIYTRAQQYGYSPFLCWKWAITSS